MFFNKTLLFLAFFVIAISTTVHGKEISTARVTASALKIRTEPRMDAEVITIAKRNDLITVKTVSRNYSIYEGITAPWLEVSTATGKKGWAFGGYVERKRSDDDEYILTYQLHVDDSCILNGTNIVLKKTPLLALPYKNESNPIDIPAGEVVTINKRYYGANEFKDGFFWYHVSYRGSTGYINGNDLFLGLKTEGDNIYGIVQKPLSPTWINESDPYVIKENEIVVYSRTKNKILQRIQLPNVTDSVSFQSINLELDKIPIKGKSFNIKHESDIGGWGTSGHVGWKTYALRNDGTLGNIVFQYYSSVVGHGDIMIEQTSISARNNTITIDYDYAESPETGDDNFQGTFSLIFSYDSDQNRFHLQDISSKLKLIHPSASSEKKIKAGLGEPKRQLTREWLNQLVSELTKGDPFIP